MTLRRRERREGPWH